MSAALTKLCGECLGDAVHKDRRAGDVFSERFCCGDIVTCCSFGMDEWFVIALDGGTITGAQRLATRARVLADIDAERDRQHARWGVQRLPHGDCLPRNDEALKWVRAACEKAEADGTLTWRHLVDEELCEARVETDPVKKRAELVQLAALIVQQIEGIDRDAMEAK